MAGVDKIVDGIEISSGGAMAMYVLIFKVKQETNTYDIYPQLGSVVDRFEKEEGCVYAAVIVLAAFPGA